MYPASLNPIAFEATSMLVIKVMIRKLPVYKGLSMLFKSLSLTSWTLYEELLFFLFFLLKMTTITIVISTAEDSTTTTTTTTAMMEMLVIGGVGPVGVAKKIVDWMDIGGFVVIVVPLATVDMDTAKNINYCRVSAGTMCCIIPIVALETIVWTDSKLLAIGGPVCEGNMIIKETKRSIGFNTYRVRQQQALKSLSGDYR